MDLIEIFDASGNSLGQGIVVAFSNEVSWDSTENHHVFEALVRSDLFLRTREERLECRCPLVTPHIAVKATPASGLITSAIAITAAPNTPPPGGFMKALALLIDKPAVARLQGRDGGDILVRMRGDFVLDRGNRAIDAEFVRAELPTGDRPSGATVGIQGGTFESWFTTKGR